MASGRQPIVDDDERLGPTMRSFSSVLSAQGKDASRQQTKKRPLRQSCNPRIPPGMQLHHRALALLRLISPHRSVGSLCPACPSSFLCATRCAIKQPNHAVLFRCVAQRGKETSHKTRHRDCNFPWARTRARLFAIHDKDVEVISDNAGLKNKMGRGVEWSGALLAPRVVPEPVFQMMCVLSALIRVGA